MKTKQEIEDFLENLDTLIFVLDYIDIEDIDPEHPFESIYDMIDANKGFKADIGYYYEDAAKFLAKIDPSGKQRAELAASYECKVEDIGTELLASLLLSKKLREQFLTLKDKIDNFFKN